LASRHRFLIDGREHIVLVDEVDGCTTVAVDGDDAVEVDATTSGLPGLFSLLVDGSPSNAFVSRRRGGFEVTVGGRRFTVEPAAGSSRERGPVGGLEDPPGKVSAPLAGVVVEVHVQVGDEIEVGQALLVIEAMKMQNELQAPLAGAVTAVRVAAGERVEKGAVLVEYDPADAE
jgi:biotin carboxyl carrier protein